MKQQHTTTGSLCKAAGSMLLFIVLLMICGFVSCNRDGDDGPIAPSPKELYQIAGDLADIEEIPCLDNVPIYDPSQMGSPPQWLYGHWGKSVQCFEC